MSLILVIERLRDIYNVLKTSLRLHNVLKSGRIIHSFFLNILCLLQKIIKLIFLFKVQQELY